MENGSGEFSDFVIEIWTIGPFESCSTGFDAFGVGTLHFLNLVCPSFGWLFVGSTLGIIGALKPLSLKR